MAYKNDIGFDIDKAKEYIDDYSRAVGLGCFLIDMKGKTIYRSCNNRYACSFCANIENLTKKKINCSRAHLYGSYQAERFGGKYIFFCPVGLVHWTSPIVVDSIMRGAIVGGPVQMQDPDDFFMDTLLEFHCIDTALKNILKDYIDKVPVVDTRRVNSLAELLSVVAAYISDIKPSEYYELRDLQEQQSYISDYLQYFKTMGGNTDSIPSYPIEKEKELLSLISFGDKPGAQRVLNEILGYIFFSTGGNFKVIKARVLELIVLLSRAALEGGADAEQIFGLNYSYLNQINNFKTIEELTGWVSRIMARFTDCVFNFTDVKHVDVIYKAIKYIKKNYMKKITLEEVASHVYLSPSYFSKIFKEEMKISFNSYLNQIRIDVAKSLLLNNSVVLVDISGLVGFEDQSYFSKVFKKITGVSPGKYRESRGKH